MLKFDIASGRAARISRQAKGSLRLAEPPHRRGTGQHHLDDVLAEETPPQPMIGIFTAS
jgi:hypothetical protein